MMILRACVAAAALVAVIPIADPLLSAQDRPTFRAGVAVVPITAVVRDSRGRLVTDLTRDDFEVLENGRPRPIVDFKATGNAPISLAVLFDTSSSMRDANLTQGRTVVSSLLQRMNMSSDEIALFTFDKSLREETPFTNDPAVVRQAVEKTVAWGFTSLYDATAETAKRLGDRRTQRRAVIVITDGGDNTSTMKPKEASTLANSVDVPVYVLTVARPRRGLFGSDDTLANLAGGTGGDELRVHPGQDLEAALGGLIAELRQMYFLAIDSATATGSYRLDVKVRRSGVKVRARTGYVT